VQSEHRVNIHNTLTQWFQPNPLCCNEHNLTRYSARLLCDAFPEEVIMVLLQYHILLPDQNRNRQNSATSSDPGWGSSLNPDMQRLKLGILFIPHYSPEDIDPAIQSYAWKGTWYSTLGRMPPGPRWEVTSKGDRLSVSECWIQDVSNSLEN
jgi:hypothetical protein